MKKLISIILVLSFALAMPVFAAEKGASATAVQKASDEAIFYRVSDWFATRGKTGAERDAILAERKAGDAVNLEVDIIGKYAVESTKAPGSGITAEFLQENGFPVN